MASQVRPRYHIFIIGCRRVLGVYSRKEWPFSFYMEQWFVFVSSKTKHCYSIIILSSAKIEDSEWVPSCQLVFFSSQVHTSPGGLNRNVFNIGRMWFTHAPWVHSWSHLWVFIAPASHPGRHQRNSPAEALSPPFLLHQWAPQSTEMVQTETKSRMMGNEYVKGKTKPRGCHREHFSHVKLPGPPLHMKGQKEKKTNNYFDL